MTSVGIIGAGRIGQAMARIALRAGGWRRPSRARMSEIETLAPLYDARAIFASVAGFRHTVTNVWSDVDAVITELQVHYTRLDGIELTLPCCNVFRVRDGAVADYRVYIDMNPVYA
jgi:limonene-1,2-epoxide hydrolase